MFSFSALSRGIVSGFVASAIVVIASCGGSDDGLGTRFPVAGKVTYNGKPLEKGAISFVPDNPKGGGGRVPAGRSKMAPTRFRPAATVTVPGPVNTRSPSRQGKMSPPRPRQISRRPSRQAPGEPGPKTLATFRKNS